MDNQAALLSPPGNFTEVSGRKIHWREWGTSTDLPPIVLECGLSMMSSAWGWLAPLLAQHTRVLAWDRPGLGWSEDIEGARDASRICDEFFQWIQANLQPPFMFLGHSLGALIARVAHARNPAAFAGLIFLDGAHPHQMRQPKTRRRMRNFFLLLEGASLLASRGLSPFTLPIASELEHLPQPDRLHALHFLKDARHLRTTTREARAWEQSSRAATAPLEDIPLLVISAQKHSLPGWNDLQNDLASASRHSNHVTFTDATHISLLGRQEHAKKSSDAILDWLRKL